MTSEIRPRLLDLYCCAGGAAMGYHRAGFDVVGVDVKPQPRFPFEFIETDVLTLDPAFLASFDAIHASPPCQAFSYANNCDAKGVHPNLVPQTREMLAASGTLTVIENVPGAPIRADLVLDGTMFPDLRVIRKRLFELNWPAPLLLGFSSQDLVAKGWCSVTDGDNSTHVRAARKKRGLPVRDSNATRAEAMGIDWTTNRRELGMAIPPAYTQFIGERLLSHLRQREAA